MPAARRPARALLLVALAATAGALAGAAPAALAQTSVDLKLAVEPTMIELAPGGVANVTLVLHNPTARALALELGAQPQNATPTVSVTFARPQVTLAPNETQRVLATVKALPRATPGDQPILLGAHEVLSTATAKSTGGASATARLAVHIVKRAAPLPQPTLASTPALSRDPADPAVAAAATRVAQPDAAPGAEAGVAQAGILLAGGAAAVAGGAWTFSWLRRRGGWLALAAPLYTRLAPHKILDQPTRKALADLVLREPGVTFSEAQRALGIGAGALTHHARMLERSGIVFSSPDGQTRRLFPVAQGYVAPVAPLAERALAELRHEPASLSALARRLGVSKQALHYHVKRLVAEGKVRAEGERLVPA